jgi:hypothetical protein
MTTLEAKLEAARKSLVYNQAKVEAGITAAEQEEKNSSPRYNPFDLLERTPELTAAIERDRKNRSEF